MSTEDSATEDSATERSSWAPGWNDSLRSLVEHRQRFVVTAGRDRGLDVTVASPRAVLGTASTSDVRLSDTTVSRQHAEVAFRDDRYVLRDLSSTNGTWLNGAQVFEAVLAPDGLFRIGDTELRFEPNRKWVDVPPSPRDHFGDLYGISQPMHTLFGLLGRIAPTRLTCLITGETGTGKELVARALHAASDRAEGPFVVIDCGTVHPNLIEAELFGHERGAFTGAGHERAGAFETAGFGTVLLDEIGELPLELQTRLLRILEHREVTRLGSSTPIEVDVRILAATHRDLDEMVERGTFRSDLLFRLTEVSLPIPPLRERSNDIPGLVRRLLVEVAPGRRFVVTEEALAQLEKRPWPGNVRELRNLLRRATALSDGDVITPASLREIVKLAPQTWPASEADVERVPLFAHLPIREARERWAGSLERQYLSRVMSTVHGDLELAARHMGVLPKSVRRLLRAHGMSDED